MNTWRITAAVLGLCAVSLALAAALRFGLVEPADMTAHCDGGARDAWCNVRAWVIQGFVHQRMGWFALVLAGWAYWARWNYAAALALFVACAGLVLYTTELCAPAALLALLALTREPKLLAPANNSKTAPY